MKPWIPFVLSDYLEYLIGHTWEVFEWGTGESTLWFAERCQRVLTVEHDERFRMIDPPQNVNQLMVLCQAGEIGPDKSNPTHYKSGSTELGAVNFKQYASVIDRYGFFDLVFIDGRARASCISHAVSHTNCIVIDNTDRTYYLERTEVLLADWDKVTFYGRGPRLGYPWEATVFLK